MTKHAFVDHYETLQLSPSADVETIGRVYRLLAKRFHPDNTATGDVEMFDGITKSYEVLSHPEQRAKYDVTYDDEKGHEWRIFDQRSASNSHEEDRRVFHSVLSLLYVARRRDPDAGGLGVVHHERMLGVPKEHLEFPLWYLRRRGWTETLDGGQLAITVEGIDVLGGDELALPKDRLIADVSAESSTSAADSHSLGEGEMSTGGRDDTPPHSLVLSPAQGF